MIHKFLKELEDRKTFVEKTDFDMLAKSRDHFRDFWLHMVILSSAIVIGILPLINQESTLIKSLTLAKLGLLLIILVCVLIILYYQNALSKTRSVLVEQSRFHDKTFSEQFAILNHAAEKGLDENEVEKIFNDSKNCSYIQEEKIVAKYILSKRFIKFRILIDKYFNCVISYIFVLGILLVIFSFV